jgi:hypothetical protein
MWSSQNRTYEKDFEAANIYYEHRLIGVYLPLPALAAIFADVPR